MTELPAHREDYRALEDAIGYVFASPEHLLVALTHPSYVNEHPDSADDNQRMEFLGDSVLNLVVARALYARYPECNEGALTFALAKLVCEPALAEVANAIELGSFVRLGRGEDLSGGRTREALLADAYEALVAAVFLDGGLDSVQQVVLRLHDNAFEGCQPNRSSLDFKSRLQKFVQGRRLGPPTYRIVEERGPAHERWFVAEAVVEERGVAQGEGRTKKAAEQAAARLAYGILTKDS